MMDFALFFWKLAWRIYHTRETVYPAKPLIEFPGSGSDAAKHLPEHMHEAMLKSLSERLYIVLLKSVFEGYTGKYYIGKEFGITQERVDQLLKNAMRRMKRLPEFQAFWMAIRLLTAEDALVFLGRKRNTLVRSEDLRRLHKLTYRDQKKAPSLDFGGAGDIVIQGTFYHEFAILEILLLEQLLRPNDFELLRELGWARYWHLVGRERWQDRHADLPVPFVSAFRSSYGRQELRERLWRLADHIRRTRVN